MAVYYNFWVFYKIKNRNAITQNKEVSRSDFPQQSTTKVVGYKFLPQTFLIIYYYLYPGDR